MTGCNFECERCGFTDLNDNHDMLECGLLPQVKMKKLNSLEGFSSSGNTNNILSLILCCIFIIFFILALR